MVVRRSALNDVLAGALASGTVHHGVTAKEIELTSDGVRITLSDSTTRQAAAVIGADGTHSVVARYLNGPLRNRYAGYTAWRGIAEYALNPDLAGETLGAGVECGHVPLGPDHTYWFATERAPEGRVAPGARVGTDRPARQPAAGLPERRGQPGHGLGARGGADGASRGDGVAIGVRRPRGGLSLGRTG